jgi:hypothetical protein
MTNMNRTATIVLAGFSLWSCGIVTAAQRQPNIVILLADDSGQQISSNCQKFNNPAQFPDDWALTVR